MTNPQKKTRKQRENDRMAREGTPLAIQVRAHLHPETLAPMIRLKVGNKLDISLPAQMMRQVGMMITDAVVMSELMAGHCKMLAQTPDLTMAEYGEGARKPYTQADITAAIHRACQDYQAFQLEAWNLGATGRQASAAPMDTQPMQDQVVDLLRKAGFDAAMAPDAPNGEGETDAQDRR